MNVNECYEQLIQYQDILAKRFAVQKDIDEKPKVVMARIETMNKLKKQCFEKLNKVKELEERVYENQKHIMAINEQQNGDEKAKVIKSREIDGETGHSAISEKEQKIKVDISRDQKMISDINTDIEKNQMQIANLEKEISVEQARLDGELEKLKAEIKSLSDQEQAIMPDLDDTFKYKFERIVKNKEGSGIVTVTQGHCNGCYLVLPPEFINRIRAGKEVQYCPNCSRILYWTEDSQGIFAFDDNEDDDDYFKTSDD